MDIIIISFLFLLRCLFGENGHAQYFMLFTVRHSEGEKFLFGPERIPWDALAFYPARILCYHLLLVEENSAIERRWVGWKMKALYERKNICNFFFIFFFSCGRRPGSETEKKWEGGGRLVMLRQK